MRHLPCLSSIVFMVLFRNRVCASQCENGIITDSLMSKTYSKDECLAQSSGKHCFKPIEKGGGLCYLAQDEKITHSGKDCNFHLPIVYESRNITIPEVYLNQTFSETLLMNGSFPESALKHCQNINCYLVVYEQTSDIAYFMVDPKELNFEDSGIAFEASDKHYTMYFQPKCEPTKPRGRTTLEEACRDMGREPDQAVFALEEDLSITESNYISVNSCATRCSNIPSCRSFMWFPKTDVCKFWAGVNSNNQPPSCVVEPLTDRIFPESVKLYETGEGKQIDYGGVLAISHNVPDCWNNCAKHPLCVSAAITPEKCYLIDDNQRAIAPALFGPGLRFVHLNQKLFANEDHCDFGTITDTTVNFNDDRERCEKRGLCYRDFGTSDDPFPFCFKPAKASERPSMDLGEEISAHARWNEPGLSYDLLASAFTNAAQNNVPSSYDECVEACIKVSCFVAYFVDGDGKPNVCKLAMSSFLYEIDPDSSDTLEGDFAFIKYKSNSNDVCADVGPPPENAEFVAEDDPSTIETGFEDVLQCKARCVTLSCTDYTFLPQQNACKFWQGDDDSTVRASSSQTCVMRPLAGMRAFALTSSYYKADAGINMKPSHIMSVNENVDNCWDQCARHPQCYSVAITEEYCYLLEFGAIVTPVDGLEFRYLSGKKFDEDTFCNAGEIEDHLLPFKDDPSKCQSLGMCHKNLGTPETPNLACYIPKGPEQIRTLTHEDGKTTHVFTKWTSSIYTETAFKSDFPIERSIGGDLDECLEICAELSCLVFGSESNNGEINACRFATTEPLTYVPESSSDTDIRLRLTIFFAKHTSLVNELCPVEEPLPANWQFHFASYNSYEEAKDTTFEDCEELCDPRPRQCNKAIVYRPETSSCFIFESTEIFDSTSGSPSTNPNLKKECIVEPANGGKFRPKTVFEVVSRTGIVSEEPREMIYFPLTSESLPKRNWCWEYCSQMLWCKALHFLDSKCLFFDREENTLRDATANDRQDSMTVMKGKQFADQDFCDRGGAIDETFFWYLWYDKEGCDYYNLCHRDTTAGEKTLSLCYLRREIQPEPIRISPVCEAQPFFTSNPGSSKSCTEFQYDYTVRPEGSASYDACTLICITDENCYGFVYFPTTQECKTMANNASIFDYSKRAAIAARNDDDNNADDNLECQIAWEVPFCEPCYQKVQMEQQITYKEELQCTHTMQESCSDVYKTIFKTQEVEECKESFVKNCHIEYEMVPTSEKVEICHSPLTRDCNEEGPEICSTEYETVCATTYHENEVTDDVVNCNTVKEEVCDSDNENCRMVPRQVCEVEQVTGKKLTPETDCHQESREVCGPEVCPIVPGERICADEIKTFVREVPQEKCEISPKTVCNMIHKIVPKLEMNQECIEVPQENCQRVQVEAKKEMVPVIKHFCASVGSDSSEESTEMDDNSSSPNPSTSLRSATEEQTSHLAYQNSSLFDHFPFSARGSRRNSKSGR